MAGIDLSQELFGDAAPKSGGRDLSAELSISPKSQPEPFGKRLNREIANVPRQLGLTARYGMEGVGNTFDFLSAPIRSGLNAVLPDSAQINPGGGQYLADKIGLPTPQNATERVVGDMTRMGFGGAVPLGIAGNVAKHTSGATQAVAKLMASNPAQQIASAGAAGGAGGYVRETGGNDTAQLLASLAAGVGTPMAMNGVQRGAQSAAAVGRRLANPTVPQVQIDLHINNAMQSNGLSMADLPANVASGIRSDVAKAMQISGNLSPDAIRRLADYRLTGTAPTASTLTLDPAMVSQQKNLAKLGINSKDPAAQQLGRVENANNRQLITGLNEIGANTADDAYAGGQKIMGALGRRNDTAKSLIDARYTAARATDGRSAALDPHAFTNQANNLLDESLLGGKLPADVRNLLNKTASGEMPLTVDTAEQFKTRIGELQRSTIDMAERKALGLVRQSLDNTPLLDGQGQPAIDAFNRARGLNRAWMGIVDKTPALQAVRDGIEPDKFVSQFIVGNGGNANAMDVAMLKNSIKSSPEAMGAVKNQITSYLKKAALNGANDEVGNFSQSAYNKAMNAIGDRKLALFFSKEDISQIKAIGRVASYEQFQPKGSAVNNSNTASASISALLDRVGSSPLLSKIPFGKQIVGDPLQSITLGMQSKRALNVPQSIAGRAMVPGRPGLMLSPAMLMSGDDEKKKQKGLLFP